MVDVSIETVRDFADPLPSDFSAAGAGRRPLFDADTPATQAYYAMKSANGRHAIVVDDGAPIGVLMFDRLAEVLRSDSLPDAAR
jgi:hypothetical protein